jgi:hypothetical protein
MSHTVTFLASAVRQHDSFTFSVHEEATDNEVLAWARYYAMRRNPARGFTYRVFDADNTPVGTVDSQGTH